MARAVRQPTLDAPLADMVFRGTWLVRTGDGGYLDFDPGTRELRNVPVARLRHGFRIQRIQDVRTGACHVILEPVPMSDAHEAAGSARSGTAPSVQLPFHLTRTDCFQFELRPQPPLAEPTTPPTAAAHTQGADIVRRLTGTLRPEAQVFSLELQAGTLLTVATGSSFPEFAGDAGRAFSYIEAQLGFDPHSPLLDAAALARVHRPSDIPEPAWQKVTDQLNLEISYRFRCARHFAKLTAFTQNAFIPNVTLVDTVGSLVQLDGNQLLHLVISGVFGAVARGVGSLGFKGAGVVGGALDVVFKVALRDRGAGQAEMAVALNNARDSLRDLFNGLITAIEKLENGVYADWGKLQEMAKALERTDSQWPEDDQKMREEAARQIEIAIWQALLKVKWHHMTASDDPSFRPSYSEAEKAGWESAHLNYWVGYQRLTGVDAFGKELKGFLITMHWLGYGNQVLIHHEPHDAMCDRLFNKLRVPRNEVFTGAEWGLTHEVFRVPHA